MNFTNRTAGACSSNARRRQEDSPLATRIVLLTTLTLLLVANTGCRRGNTQAPPPRSETARNSAPPAEGERKTSAFARLLGRDTVPAYGWDGHASSTTLSTSPDIIFDSSLAALRGMGFSIKTEETRRQGASGRIFGAKTDKTQALVTLEPKADGKTGTELKVKVGTVGDRTGSERILDEIQEVIAKAPRK